MLQIFSANHELCIANPFLELQGHCQCDRWSELMSAEGLSIAISDWRDLSQQRYTPWCSSVTARLSTILTLTILASHTTCLKGPHLCRKYANCEHKDAWFWLWLLKWHDCWKPSGTFKYYFVYCLVLVTNSMSMSSLPKDSVPNIEFLDATEFGGFVL